jgi:Stress responsive A/B Barrel Domain
MIRHLVFFKFKPETTDAERAELLALIQALPGKIAEVLSLEAGFDIVRSPRSFDLALDSTFEDLVALGVYGKHPEHQPVIELAKTICDQIAAVDFEV